MILGRALCGIKFLGAKLKQSHLEKTWLGWLVVPHPKKKCFVFCVRFSPLCHSPGAILRPPMYSGGGHPTHLM